VLRLSTTERIRQDSEPVPALENARRELLAHGPVDKISMSGGARRATSTQIGSRILAEDPLETRALGALDELRGR